VELQCAALSYLISCNLCFGTSLMSFMCLYLRSITLQCSLMTEEGAGSASVSGSWRVLEISRYQAGLGDPLHHQYGAHELP
jgi:hypothetical protein